MRINEPKTFKPQSYQEGFVYSTEPYPARVAPWGDGKTLCAIVKGLALSEFYPGNSGIFVRRRLNALQRSTMRDFEDWTGFKIPEQKKVVRIPGCDSTIDFVHAEDIHDFQLVIKSMNLGWAVIEQAEELDDAAVFDELIGRVRRILTPNEQIQRKLIKMGMMKGYTDDLSTKSQKYRDQIEKAIIEKLGLPVRQIIIIANTCGHNWIYKRWKEPIVKGRASLEGYGLYEGVPFENTQYIPGTTKTAWKNLRKTNPKKYNRFILNSWEDYDIEGAYYAALMSDALKEDRTEIVNLCDKTVPVYTFWDLGVRGADSTSIWFVQFIENGIHLIDFYGNSGKGMDFYSQILSEKGYAYAEHWLPHDAEQRLQGPVITTRLDILRRLRKHEDVYIVDRHSLAERHEAVRSLLNKCKFDSKCEDGVEALNLYHREIHKAKSSDEQTVFTDHPAKDRYSHPADAFGYMAIVYRYQPVDGKILGYTGANPEWFWDEGASVGVTDLLEV